MGQGPPGSRQKLDLFGRPKGRGGQQNKNTAWISCMHVAQAKGARVMFWFRVLHPKPGDEGAHANWVKWLQDTGAWPNNFLDGTWINYLPEEWRPTARSGIYGPEWGPNKTSAGTSWSNTDWNSTGWSNRSAWSTELQPTGGASSSAGPSNPNESEPDFDHPAFIPDPGEVEYSRGAWKRRKTQ